MAAEANPSPSPVATRTGLARRLPWIARLAICALLFVLILHGIFRLEAIRMTPPEQWAAMSRSEQLHSAWSQGPAELAGTFTRLKPASVVTSLAVMGLILLTGVARWRMVLAAHGLRLSWSRAIEISLISHFFNSFLLGSAGGDVMRAVYAARETRHQKTEAVITVFVDRILGLWSLLLFGCMMMIPNYGLLLQHPQLRSCCLLVLAMAGAGTVIVTLAFRGGLAHRWKGPRALLAKMPKAATIERSLRACRRFGKHPGSFLRVFFVSMGLNLLCVLHVQVIANGLDKMPLDPLLTALIVPVITVIIALPITPNGLGMREYLFVQLLSAAPLGIDASAAFALSLWAYGGSVFWSLVGGVVYLTFRRKHHLEDIAQAQS